VTTRPEPRHPGRLAGSKWSRCDGDDGLCHYVAIEVSRDEVVLQAVLDPRIVLRLPWRALRDRARWRPGWT